MSPTSISPVCNQSPIATRSLYYYGFNNRRLPAASIRRMNALWPVKFDHCWGYRTRRKSRLTSVIAQAGSRADDSAPYQMSLENALKLLGVPEGGSFDDIMRAKNSILASCKGDKEAIAQFRSVVIFDEKLVRSAQTERLTREKVSRTYMWTSSAEVEAAYDMLLMQSLMQRRAGKVKDNSILYADVKLAAGEKPMPRWLQTTFTKSPVVIDKPSMSDLGVQAGVYGAMMVVTYINGVSTSPAAPYAEADVPALVIATSLGASLYFLTKSHVKLGRASLITIGGLMAGAVVGSAVENWLQVDVVPFLGLHSPAAVVSEFVVISQFLSSVYLR